MPWPLRYALKALALLGVPVAAFPHLVCLDYVGAASLLLVLLIRMSLSVYPPSPQRPGRRSRGGAR